MWRMRKRTRRRILLVAGCIGLQCCFLFFGQMILKEAAEKKYEVMLKEQEERLQAATRVGYITRKEIKAGEAFTEENTEKRYLISEQNAEALVTEIAGMIACSDLQEGVILTKSHCYEGECNSTERECVYYNIGAAEFFSAYEVVDVRLRYANGENYCVLKKKRLQKEEENKEVCHFFLTEEEQLLMSAAQYDVDMYAGAELYLVGFMESRLQEVTESAYLPSVQVISQLCERNEEYRTEYGKWCSLRRALEERLSEHRKQRLEGLS